MVNSPKMSVDELVYAYEPCDLLGSMGVYLTHPRSRRQVPKVTVEGHADTLN
jgi:hypothetical protein